MRTLVASDYLLVLIVGLNAWGSTGQTAGQSVDDDANPQALSTKEEPASTQQRVVFGPAADPKRAVAPFDGQQARRHQLDWAKSLEVPVEFTNSIGMRLVLIPPGEFKMGSLKSEQQWDSSHPETQRFVAQSRRILGRQFPGYWFKPEGPQHRVAITNPFYLGTHEVTVGQYRQFVEATNRQPKGDNRDENLLVWSAEKGVLEEGRPPKKPLDWRDPGFSQSEDHPVVLVSWDDAVAFCEWLSGQENRHYVLPTEAQWEYACRAGAATRFHFGDDTPELGEYAWFHGNAGHSTHPVGQKKPNGWGVHDMQGNAGEWCADWYGEGYYATSPANDPSGPDTGSYRVFRGGDWRGPCSTDCRSARRFFGWPHIPRDRIGFRVVLAPVK